MKDESPPVALGMLSAVVLGLEVFQTRIVAYSVHVVLVYAVIGIALLGFGAAGTLVSLKPGWLAPGHLSRALAYSALAFAALIVLSHGVFLRLTPRLGDVDALSLLVSLLLSLPFLAAGTVVTLALSSASQGVAMLYAANLVGSGLGCFLPLGLLGPVSGERLLALFALFALACAAVYVFRVPAPHRRLRIAGLLTLALCAAAATWPERFFPIHPEPPPTGQLAGQYEYAAKAGIKVHKRFDRWNPTGRIEIVQFENVPGGPEPYPAMFYAQDSTAGSSLIQWDGRTRSTVRPSASDPGTFVSRMCSETIYAQGYFQPRERVLVIGLGGGPDLECALYNEVRSVDVVEINRDSIAAVRGPFNRWLGGAGRNPRVHFHVRDGRSFVRSNGTKYDLIQLSGVDTKNNLASGGLALSENHLYTLEAFEDYFERLTDDGVVSIIRFGEAEALRLSSTAMTALQSRGVSRPEDHVAIVHIGLTYGVIVGRQPWKTEKAIALHGALNPPHFRGVRIYYYSENGVPLEQPSFIDYLPPFIGIGAIGKFFELSRVGMQSMFESVYPWKITPPTDDQPFFFDIWRYDLLATWKVAPHVRALRNLLGSMIGLAVVLILIPLRRLRRTQHAASLAPPLFFLCIGLAYVLIEIYLLHSLSMFLGHQAYSLSVVLSSLLLSTGAGAALGHRLFDTPRRRASLGALSALVLALGVVALRGPVLALAWDASLPVRAAVAVAFVAPLGFAMGQPFVAALAFLRANQPERIAWCIGINGFASVLASTAVVPLSMATGYSGVVAVGMLLYALATGCAAMFLSDARSPSTSRA